MLAASGGYAQSATVSWQANTESDLNGYKIYYGRSPRRYNLVMDVGNKIELKIRLPGYGLWYFAVTSYDNSLNESAYSNEVSILLADQSSYELPANFMLSQNYPNPFNPETSISFTLPNDSQITLKIFDILGREIRTLSKGLYKVGSHSIIWDGRDDLGNFVSNGIYLYQIQAGSFQQVRKMMLLR